MRNIVEKPDAQTAPSNLGVVGRYILMPAIFNILKNTPKDSRGEIQLTDAIAQLLKQETVSALQFVGKRYDCGSKLGYLEATIAYALKHPELSQDFAALLREITEGAI
jgi:UTP--glucose-1-phosphate uridylyltransferase